MIDSSVLVKLFVQEDDSEVAKELIITLHNQKISLLLPDLVLYELANALRWNKNLNKEDIATALLALEGIGATILPASAEIILQAVSLAHTCNTTVYDAVFLALAQQENCVLITADASFGRKTSNCLTITQGITWAED